MSAELSLFTIPKPFIGHSAVIQLNAIQSWLKLIPANQIYLFGDEEGISDVSREYGINQIAEIRKNKFGTPFLSDAFTYIQKVAQTDLICYANTDIVFLSDLTEAVEKIQKSKFLMVGRRWNLDVAEPIVFSLDWEEKLRNQAKTEGNLFSEFGIDYFLFPRGMVQEFPDFVVGRPGWDNWLIFNTRMRRICVIDATESVTVIHQNHNYWHVPQARTRNTYMGPEAEDNLRLVGEKSRLFSINDATHMIKSGKQKVDYSNEKVIARINHQTVLRDHAFLVWLVKGINYIYKRFIQLLLR